MYPIVWLPPVGVFAGILAIGGAIVAVIEFKGAVRILLVVLSIGLGAGEIASIVKADAAHNSEVEGLKKALDKVQITLQATQIQSAQDMGYLKGRLDTVAAMSAGRQDLSQLATAMTKANQDAIRKQWEVMSNEELSKSAVALAQRMREFEGEWHNRRDAILNWNRAGTREEQNQRWNQMITDLNQDSERARIDFQNQYLGRAVFLRDELVSRLGTKAPPIKDRFGARLIAFDGILAGPAPISDAASYLEKLALMLSPRVATQR